jgi:hypothetical protein
MNRGDVGNMTWAISTDKIRRLGIHASETSWVGTKFDAELDNNSTLDDLFAQVEELLANTQVQA